MTFQLYDSLSRSLKPLQPSEATPDGTPILRMYSCGPTVYSYAHIGNFRTFLTADLVVRTAEAVGWRVRSVSNVTDVGHLTGDDAADADGEDKLAKAFESKEGEAFANVWDLARHYTGALLRDWQTLNLKEPDVRPRATEHIAEQIEAVQALIAAGHAYETPDGVYFHVPSFPDYGKLSGNTDAEGLATGAAGERRATVDAQGKRDPRDFALWKKAVGAQEGHLMQWYSPFSEQSPWGFPGWHLECSVMAQKYLGETIDLHLGGEDLRFPHHECEIAQAEALTGEPFARHWGHTRFLLVEGERMSKSSGTFYTVRDLVQAPPVGREDLGAPVEPLALRLALIAGHYRKPLDFTLKGLKDARKNARRYAEADALVQASLEAGADGEDRLQGPLEAAYHDALAAMLDDLNTPEALAAAYRGTNAILGQAKQHGGTLSRAAAETAQGFLDRVNALLGIVRPDVKAPTLKGTASEPDAALAEQVEALIAQRAEARAARDFARADALRDELDALGVDIMDSPTGTTWRPRID